MRAQSPDKPFFLYFPTGSSHSPHQVVQPWRDKDRGRFDEGWDVLRERVFKGMLTGSFNELVGLNGIILSYEQQVRVVESYGGLDARGGPTMHPHYAAAWGWPATRPSGGASRSPRTSVALAIPWWCTGRWASGTGGVCGRSSPTAPNIAPTILEITGIPQPNSVNGVTQMPMHGTSFVYTFDEPQAPEQHRRQYFEIFRQPGHVRGRLVGRCPARPDAVGLHSGDAGEVRARCLVSRL
jgi:hypothetical protein